MDCPKWTKRIDATKFHLRASKTAFEKQCAYDDLLKVEQIFNAELQAALDKIEAEKQAAIARAEAEKAKAEAAKTQFGQLFSLLKMQHQSK